MCFATNLLQTLYVCAACASLSIFGSALIPWLSLKNKDGQSEEPNEKDVPNVKQNTIETV